MGDAGDRLRRAVRRALGGALLLAGAALPALAAGPEGSGANWPSFFGNDAAWSYSTLDQVNTGNVGGLAPVWIFQTGERGMAATPLVIDGVMYLTTANKVWALDAATGRQLWRYVRELPEGRVGRGSAGLAVGQGLVFFGTPENHLVALDIKTGREVWDVQVEDPQQCGCGPSFAPILVKDKVVMGVRGEVAHRSYINAFDARTGRLAWRFWSIPGPGEAGHDSWPGELWRLGGGSTWYVGSYDPELNTVYWGVGNPAPMIGGTEGGDKLYTNSLVALDADTGKVKWHWQAVPNDNWDFDATTEPVLLNVQQGGRTRKLVISTSKSGFAYTLDRETGELIKGWPYVDKITWAKGLDAKGRPTGEVRLEQGVEKLICPSLYGGRAGNHSSYSPRTGLWYNTSFEVCGLEKATTPGKKVEGQFFNAGAVLPRRSPDTQPFIAAFDPLTGKRQWTFPTRALNVSSLMSTAGDLLFGGDLYGEAFALDARSGRKLWTFNVGGGVTNSPVSYAVGGRQYVAIGSGTSAAPASLAPQLWPEQAGELPPVGSAIVVFALPQSKEAR
jgi:alcohol dehydrogenase (cytochrome c)